MTNTENNLQQLAQDFLEIILRGNSITTYELKRKTLAQILESTQGTLVNVGAKLNPELLLNEKKVKAKGLFTGEFLAYFKNGRMVETPIYEHHLPVDPNGDWYETSATQIPFQPSDRVNEKKPTAYPCNAMIGILNGQGEIDENSVIKYCGSPEEDHKRGHEYKVSVLINEDEESIANHMNSETFREFTQDRNGTYKITVQGFVEQIYVNHDKSKDENGNFKFQDVDPETGKGCVLYIVLKGVQASIRLHNDDPRKKAGLKKGWEKGREAMEAYERLEASKKWDSYESKPRGEAFDVAFADEIAQAQAQETAQWFEKVSEKGDKVFLSIKGVEGTLIAYDRKQNALTLFNTNKEVLEKGLAPEEFCETQEQLDEFKEVVRKRIGTAEEKNPNPFSGIYSVLNRDTGMDALDQEEYPTKQFGGFIDQETKELVFYRAGEELRLAPQPAESSNEFVTAERDDKVFLFKEQGSDLVNARLENVKLGTSLVAEKKAVDGKYQTIFAFSEDLLATQLELELDEETVNKLFELKENGTLLKFWLYEG